MYCFYFVEFAPGSKGTFVAYLLQLLLGKNLVLLDNKTNHMHNDHLNEFPVYLFNRLPFLPNFTEQDLENCKSPLVFSNHEDSIYNKDKVKKIYPKSFCKHIKILWKKKDLESIFANRWKKVYIDCYKDNKFINGKVYWEDMIRCVYKDLLHKEVKNNEYPKPLDLSRNTAQKFFCWYLKNKFLYEECVAKHNYYLNDIDKNDTLRLNYDELGKIDFLDKIIEFISPVILDTNCINNAKSFALDYISKQNITYENLMHLYKGY